MPVYIAKVKQKTAVKTIEIQARTELEARRSIERQGRIVTFKRKAGVDFNMGMSAADRQVFFSRMSAMLQSKMGTSNALRLMRDTFSGKIQEIAARLLTHVEAGGDFATAIENVGSPDFPAATVALIKAGARSGETWRAIKDAAEFERELSNVKKGASKGLAMGIGSFVFAGVTALASVGYVGPKILESPMIAEQVEKGTVDVGWITALGWGLVYFVAVVFFIGFCFFLLQTVGRAMFPTQVDRFIQRIPYYKDLVLSRNNFIVLYGLSLLVRSGVRTEEALRLSAEGSPKGALRTDLMAAMNAVKTGRPWPDVMQTLHPTDKASLKSATDREQVATTLGALATQYRELYSQRIGSFVPIINMMAALTMTIAGGVLFGEAIMPMLMSTAGMF